MAGSECQERGALEVLLVFRVQRVVINSDFRWISVLFRPCGNISHTFVPRLGTVATLFFVRFSVLQRGASLDRRRGCYPLQ